MNFKLLKSNKILGRFGRAASGEALAPGPETLCATRLQPEWRVEFLLKTDGGYPRVHTDKNCRKHFFPAGFFGLSLHNGEKKRKDEMKKRKD